MKKEDFVAEIMRIEVLDTHSHLVGESLGARDFWDIGEYFWLLEELYASGYPRSFNKLSEKEKITAYIKAFNATKNTCMNWIVRRIFNDLFNIDIRDERSIIEANDVVRSTALSQDWAYRVAQKIAIKKIVVNEEEHTNFKNLPNTCVFIPRIDNLFYRWIDKINEASNPSRIVDVILTEMNDLFASYKNKGCKGIMTTLPDFNLKTSKYDTSFKLSQNSKDEIIVYLLHWLCKLAEKYEFFIQLFLGVDRAGWSRRPTSINDPFRIVRLHGLFDKYKCNFEIVTAAEINIMDSVQAARIFSNVHLGGLWWFSFRPSLFIEAMQKRFEALPPTVCSFVISDARCIEWCYGKILLLKRVIADYLYKKVEERCIDINEALWIANEWLYKSAAVRYGIN